MAHEKMQNYILSIKNKFPAYFNNVRVLDIGSLDINGNNRIFFDNCDYTGVDIGEGKNVDVVSLGHEYNSDKKFDVVITTELLEHDIFWKKTFLNGLNLLNNYGLYIFTCAGYGRPEHGTAKTDPNSSPFTSDIKFWENYYENRTIKDFVNILDFEENFYECSFEYNPGDLYFYGIKKFNSIDINSKKTDNIIYFKSDIDRNNIKINVIKNGNLIYFNTYSLITNNVNYWVKPNSQFFINDKIQVEIFENDVLIEKRIL
jgi:hypothetical protein